MSPGEVDILKISKLLCGLNNCELAKIKWFASIPSISDGEIMYYKHLSFLNELSKQGIIVITRKLQRLSNKEIINKQRNALFSLNFCARCKPLIEAALLNIADSKRKEKGIDVWVAVDMIKEAIIDNNCDVCILISGDADFVPALHIIREKGKEVLTAAVHFGYSSELRRKFPFFVVDMNILRQCAK